MLELMQKHFTAYANNDWDTYKADLAPDVVYEEIATGMRAEGADAYINAVKRWKTAFPDLKATIRNAYFSGDIGVAELEWSGTQSGPLETPFGTMPPSNKAGSIKAVLVSKYKDGKILETRHYFDQLSVLLQIGAAAGLGAPAPAKPEQPTVRH